MVAWFPADEPKPAPMPLRLIQGFVNSLDNELGTDALNMPAGLGGWLRAAGLLDGEQALADAGLVAVGISIREHLRAVLRHNNGGFDVVPSSAVLAHLERHPVRLDIDRAGLLRLRPDPSQTAEQALSQLLGVAFAAQQSGAWHRLKACRNPECAWAFYDTSKNRAGVWCSMQGCGNRLKNRAYRTRTRSAERG